jgi:flavin reductase (DIM6/NTAB) family NADH-FMN oxidoreductase RutF
VPAAKADKFRHEPRKFEAAGLMPQASRAVAPPRVRECPLQLEAKVTAIRKIGPHQTAACVETEVLRVHAYREIVVAGTNHVDPTKWKPLFYVFRHYFSPARVSLA